MDGRSTVLLSLIVHLFIMQDRTLAQYINQNFRSNCPWSNVPIQRNLPVNLPLSQNLPFVNDWRVRNIIADDRIRSPNRGCACNGPFFNDLSLTDRLNAEEKIALKNNAISNLQLAVSNLLPIAEKLSMLYNLASAVKEQARNINVPMTKLDVPVRKLNVPIVNDVPFGALRVARNLPMTNFQAVDSFGKVPNDMQVLGRGPIKYQNVAGTPLNNLERLKTLRDVLLRNFVNLPININNVPNVNVPNAEIMSFNNLANIPVNNVERRAITTRPPCDYIQINNSPNNIWLKNIIEKLKIANKVPMNNLLNLPINNQAIPVNNIGNPSYIQRSNVPIEKLLGLRYNDLALPPSANRRCIREPVASANGRVVASVPLVPYNSLANLPAYNGLPVIKVSESLYKLTPV